MGLIIRPDITLVGNNGDGQTAKVANQIIVALNIKAVAEALLFAAKAGADPARVRQALMGGFASSKVLEVHGERMVKRTLAWRYRTLQRRRNCSIRVPRMPGRRGITRRWCGLSSTWPTSKSDRRGRERRTSTRTSH
jgi:hypothetical protein